MNRLADRRATCSIDLGDETLARLLGPLIAGIWLAQRKLDLDRPHVLIGNLIQQMPDAVEPGSFLVIGVDDVPRGLLAVGVREHHVLGLGIFDPTLARFHVHRAELPALDRVSDALLKTPLLLLVVDREPIFDETDSRAHQHLLENRTGTQELPIFVLAAELHDALDAGAVVPAAIEQHDFAPPRELGDVSLKVPLAALALGRRAERHDAADARVEALGDALDDAPFAGGVAALEDDGDLEALQPDPFLQLDQFELQMGEFVDPRLRGFGRPAAPILGPLGVALS